MQGLEDLFMDVEHEIEIEAPMATAFEALIHELTEGQEGPDGVSFLMELEPRPGGRWFRNLGEDRGHLWGIVQSIRAPDLLEINGPLFMSYPATNHLIFRLEEIENGTVLRFRHRALGMIEAHHREGATIGWQKMLERVGTRASA